MLALAFALATAVFGWWAVPLLGAVWGGVAASTSRPAVAAGTAAGLGWILLLALTALQGPVWVLAQKAGGVLALPGWLFAVLTVGFAAALAGSAAAAVSGARRARKLLS
jgi:hypothetical protein